MGKRKRARKNAQVRNGGAFMKRSRQRKFWIEDCKECYTRASSDDGGKGNQQHAEAATTTLTTTTTTTTTSSTACMGTATTSTTTTKTAATMGMGTPTPIPADCHVLVWITRADLIDQHHRSLMTGNPPPQSTQRRNPDKVLAQRVSSTNDDDDDDCADRDAPNTPPPRPSLRCRTYETTTDTMEQQPIIFVKRARQKATKTFEYRTDFANLAGGDRGDGIRNPNPTSVVPDKFWAQRFRLFSKFDDGIQLDREGWFSVTPEAIANHISRRMVMHWEETNRSKHKQTPLISDKPASFSSPMPSSSPGMVILDAFCGVGGNSIAFALRPEVSHVICVDTSPERLKLVSNNCGVYDIPREKIILLQQDACQVMSMYRHGRLVFPNPKKESEQQHGLLDENNDCPSHKEEAWAENLPPQLDAIFLSPPWGGVDYEQIGPRQYDLSCIQLTDSSSSLASHHRQQQQAATSADAVDANAPVGEKETMRERQHAGETEGPYRMKEMMTRGQEMETKDQQHQTEERTHNYKEGSEESKDERNPVDGLGRDKLAMGVRQRRSVDRDHQHASQDETNVVDGEHVLRLAVSALDRETCNLVYFLPRNTNGLSLARSAALCGYHGLLEMEQQFVNGKLKTISAYMQSDSII